MEVLKFIAGGYLLKKYTGLLKRFRITEPQPDKTELMKDLACSQWWDRQA